jgi:hypothetical protein
MTVMLEKERLCWQAKGVPGGEERPAGLFVEYLEDAHPLGINQRHQSLTACHTNEVAAQHLGASVLDGLVSPHHPARMLLDEA